MTESYVVEASRLTNAQLLHMVNEGRSFAQPELVNAAEAELLIRRLTPEQVAAAKAELNLQINFEGVEPVIIKPAHFILLGLATFGLYELWWMYKSWRYFKQKEYLDINPALRTIFAIFFFVELLNKIERYCEEKGRQVPYNAPLLLVLVIVFNLAARLPDPFWLIGFLSIACFVSPVREFNYYFTGSFDGGGYSKLSTSQKVIIALGALFWLLVIIGLMAGDV